MDNNTDMSWFKDGEIIQIFDPEFPDEWAVVEIITTNIYGFEDEWAEKCIKVRVIKNNDFIYRLCVHPTEKYTFITLTDLVNHLRVEVLDPEIAETLYGEDKKSR